MTQFANKSDRPKTRIIGLIGGIGAGKSFVANRLRELGAMVIDADRVGHETLLDADVASTLTAEFGSAICSDSGEIDRARLGKIVFAEPERRRTLERIVHPKMADRFRETIATAMADERVPLIVLDAAILLEVGWDSICDIVVYVDASREIRMQRLARSRGWTEDQLAQRESAQWPADRKKARADVVIRNETDPDECRATVDELYRSWISGESQSGVAKENL